MRRIGVFLGIALFAACQRSSDGDSDFLAPGANNLGFTAQAFRFDGDRLVATVQEGPGVDLNGDGDEFDAAIEIVDLRTGRETVLPYAANRGFELDAGLVTFGVTECAQGADLDGDGDVECAEVLFVHDLETNRTTDLGLSLHRSGQSLYLAQEGPVLAFAVSESAQGQDLDGDGRMDRNLVYVYEADSERLTPLFIATELRPILEDGRVYVAALEAGSGDRNGDGDELDQVLLAYDVRSGALENLGRAVQPSGDLPWMGVEGPLLALMVPEGAQGVDQNGDGDLLDSLVEIRDLESGTVLPTNLPANILTVEGGLVGIYVPELTFTDSVGTDYDGDGEKLHTVAFFYDWLTGTLTNTRVAVGSWSEPFLNPPVLSNRRAGFLAIEKSDRNGDGDTEDRELVTFDARSGAAEESGLSVWWERGYLDIDPERVVCAAFVSLEPIELSSVVVDLLTGEQHDLGFAVKRQQLAEGRVLVAAYEFGAGHDLNGDGDMEDIVQQVHDPVTGVTFNTGLALSRTDAIPTSVEYENGLLAVQAYEASQGRDLNGDGDTNDFVLHVVRLP